MERTKSNLLSKIKPIPPIKGNKEEAARIERDLKKFQKYLITLNRSSATVNSYCATAAAYFSEYRTVTKENLLKWRERLVDSHVPSTVNQRING